MLKSIVIKSDRLFISFHYLINCGVSKRTIYSWQELSIAFFIKDNNETYIEYGSIPSRSKQKLPVKEALYTQAIREIETEKEIKLNEHIQFVKDKFKSDVETDYLKFIARYGKIFYDRPDKAIACAKEHAIKVSCIELNRRRPKITLRDIFEVYKELPYSWVTTNYDMFSLNHKKWRTQGINALHGSFGKPRTYLVKMTPLAVAIVEKYYKHPNQYTIDQITELTNAELSQNGQKTLSRSSVSSYVNKPEIKNRLVMYRNSELFNSSVKPIVRRAAIKMAGDLYYADGTPLQIPCWNKEMTKEIRLNIFAVIDVKTKKIIGFDLAESEDRYNVISAIKMAFELEGLLPYELKYDNASATKTEEFKELKALLELKGCRFTPTKKGNPQEKSQVERLFGTFQTSFQRMIDGFMGEGIRSKRDNGRINADFVNRLRSKDNLYTYESMMVIITNLINIYNQSAKRNKTAPSVQFSECEKSRTNKVDSSDIAMLFWKHKDIKVSRGEVTTEIRKTKYHYGIWDNELKLRYTNQTVKMYYDENDLSNVHLFSQRGEYICECRQIVMVHEGQAGQTAEDITTLIKRSKHVESIKTTIKNKTNDVRKNAMEEVGDEFLNMLSPYLVSKEKYNNAESQILMNYVLDHKDIDRDRIKEYVPINTEMEDYEKTLKRNKRKNSPMAVSGHTISVIDVEEL